jgi:hypothetical protein
MSTKIIVHFTLIGRFNPDEVSEKLGISPTKTWRFGESIQKTLASYKHDGWRLSTNEVETLDLDKQLKKIWDIIHPFNSKIINICEDLKLDAEIACSVDVEGDQYPALYFERESIKRIAELNAELDIDIF